MPKVDMSNVAQEEYSQQPVTTTTAVPNSVTPTQEIEKKGDGIGYGNVVNEQYDAEKPKATEAVTASGAKWWWWLIGGGVVLLIGGAIWFYKKHK